MRVRSLFAAALTGALVALAAPAANAAVVKPGPDPAVPASCYVGTRGYTTKGVALWYKYADGAASSAPSYVEKPLPFTPIANQNLGAAGDETTFVNTDVVVAPDGTLSELRRQGKLTNGTWLVTWKLTTIATGWKDTKWITHAHPYLYRMTSKGMLRYTLTISSTGTTVTDAAVQPGNWSSVQTMAFNRPLGDYGSNPGNVMFVTDTAGSLREVTIPTDLATAPTSVTLKTTGFAGLKSLGAGSCNGTFEQRALLGINALGQARVWYDPNANDGNGADIVGGTTIVATGWTARTYSQ